MENLRWNGDEVGDFLLGKREGREGITRDYSVVAIIILVDWIKALCVDVWG